MSRTTTAFESQLPHLPSANGNCRAKRVLQRGETSVDGDVRPVRAETWTAHGCSSRQEYSRGTGTNQNAVRRFMRCHVTELPERLRFEVQSLTKAEEKRLVDMSEFEGSGFCSCWKFAKTIRPALENQIVQWKSERHPEFSYEPDPTFECEHILAVRRHISNRLVQQVRKAYPDDNRLP